MKDENPDVKQKNFHSRRKAAFRIANAAFEELLQNDDRRLSAQTRKTIGPTAKNAYIVHNEIQFSTILPDGTRGEVKNSGFWSLRSGSPVYIGDATPDERKAYTREIFQQLRNASQEFAHKNNIHITMLLTFSFIEKQATICQVTKHVRDEPEFKFKWSYVPTNEDGTNRRLEISSLISRQNGCPSRHPNPSDRAARITKAGQIILLASGSDDTINLTLCASGQDRTGTAQEVATQMWIANQYLLQGIRVNNIDIENLRVIGCHNAVLASLAAPGSTGLKTDSKPDAYFQELTNAYFFRSTAKTNKDAPIDEAAVTLIIGQRPETLIPAEKQVAAAPVKKDEVKGGKEEATKATDLDLSWMVLRAKKIEDEYKKTHFAKKMHGAHVITLVNDIAKYAKGGDDKLHPLNNNERLHKIITELNNTWAKGIRAKITKEGKSQKENTSDMFITYLNNHPGAHSFYRSVGAFLQDIQEKFPDAHDARISTSRIQGSWLQSERAHFISTVTEADYENLKQQVEQIRALDQKESAGLTELVLLKDGGNLDHKTAYTEILSELNRIWIKETEKHSSIFHTRSLQQKNDLLVKSLNGSATQPFMRAVGSILQAAQKQYPGITSPRLEEKLKSYEFKQAAATPTPALNLSRDR